MSNSIYGKVHPKQIHAPSQSIFHEIPVTGNSVSSMVNTYNNADTLDEYVKALENHISQLEQRLGSLEKDFYAEKILLKNEI